MEHQRYLSRYCERLKKWNTRLTTNQIAKMRKVSARKAYLERLIVKNPELIGEDLKLYSRRMYTPEGISDLWFENSNDVVIVVLEPKRACEEDLDNLRRCVHYHRRHFASKKVRGILVCENVPSAFAEELKKERDIQVFCFAWNMLVFPKEWD